MPNMKNNQLEHVGVLGMKWGKRKSTSSNSNYKDYMRRERIAEARNLTDSQVKKLSKKTIKEMEDELDYDIKISKGQMAALAALAIGIGTIGIIANRS